MPLVETESLVIKSYNLAEADRIVVFLTRDHGIVRGVAKGAKRLKSSFGSGLEPFSIVKATYFEKESVELVSIQKVDLVQSNFAAASNPDFLQKFSYLGDLLITLSPPKDPNETLYRMVKASIETAAANPQSIESTGVYFELWLLRLSGYMPDWSSCDECGRAFDDVEPASVRANFHLLCVNCRRASGGRVLDGYCRSMITAARRMSPTDFAVFTTDRGDELKYLSNLLKQMFSHSIGREVAGETSLEMS
ncbi:hypothetical protein BH10ACI3_BH10ACI3_12560 [soil metagenome]